MAIQPPAGLHGWQRPRPLKFSDYSETWFDESQGRRDWKPQTVRAYRNAARTIGDLPESVAEILRSPDRQLEELSGVLEEVFS